MSIPIANPIISEAAKEAVCDVLDSGMIADGDVVREFESEFADYVGVDHAIATANGTAALHAMLEAAGIGEGDVVLTTPFSFIASANAIVHAGAEPVFADIREGTFNLDPKASRTVLEARDVDAILPVHLYGLPADMDAFRELAEEFDCMLFEDAAQAHGATYDGEPVGSLGRAGAFSFYPTKNMTTGEGGMITTDDDELAERARQVINHGRTDSYEHEFVGYNYRMTNIQAAIGRDQLQRLPEWVEKRRENASTLNQYFSSDMRIDYPTVPVNRKHTYHQYTIRTENRDKIIQELKTTGVGYGIYYPTTIPDQPAYSLDISIPTAQMSADTALSLPIHPSVRIGDLRKIAETVSTITEAA
jgi:dTDP-4-amino-4,6-dideoxygalactose transaminase